MPATENIKNAPWGLKIMLLPVDIASTHSQFSINRSAMCVATKLEEHAVSMAIHGPRMANTYDNRAPAAEIPLPVMSYGPGSWEILYA